MTIHNKGKLVFKKAVVWVFEVLFTVSSASAAKIVCWRFDITHVMNTVSTLILREAKT